jgi:di/tricarboxylate transporter
MQKTGAAEMLAQGLMGVIEGRHPVLLLAAVAVLASFFALFMSNVGAVVVLTPLVMNMAEIGEVDPRPVALLAAVCASNALILPTHQVNALLLSPRWLPQCGFHEGRKRDEPDLRGYRRCLFLLLHDLTHE